MAPTSIPPVSLDLPGTSPTPSPQTLVQRELWGNRGGRDYGLVDSTYLAGEVDEAVTVLKAVQPEYPRVMVAAAVSGEVRLEFVVAADGRCEPNSVRVVASSAQAFERPAIVAVVATVYRAARVRGQPVRQLVQQRVAFRLK
jgi:TonB family protein